MNSRPINKQTRQDQTTTNNNLLHSSDILSFRSKKVSFDHIPCIKELQSLFSESYKSSVGARIEIIFAHDYEQYLLILEYKRSIAVANWCLRCNNVARSTIIWQRQSNDVQLIHKLIIGELVSATSSGTNLSQTELVANLQKFLSEMEKGSIPNILSEKNKPPVNDVMS